MGVEVNKDRLQASLKVAEANGPLSCQDELWKRVAVIYNSGEGLPAKFKGRPSDAVTKSIVYRHVTRKFNFTVKTSKRKEGRPHAEEKVNSRKQEPAKEIIRISLEALQREAVEGQWNAANDEGWDAINKARSFLGLKQVKQIDKPDYEHFK